MNRLLIMTIAAFIVSAVVWNSAQAYEDRRDPAYDPYIAQDTRDAREQRRQTREMREANRIERERNHRERSRTDTGWINQGVE